MSLSEKLEAARIALGKRKERERERELQALQAGPAAAATATAAATAKAELLKPGGIDNKLLAGSLAHEFLTLGTVLGRRIEAAPSAVPGRRAEPAWQPARPEPDPKRRYAEMSWLLMNNGAHIPGVVNPTQLARWLQIKD